MRSDLVRKGMQQAPHRSLFYEMCIRDSLYTDAGTSGYLRIGDRRKT